MSYCSLLKRCRVGKKTEESIKKEGEKKNWKKKEGKIV